MLTYVLQMEWVEVSSRFDWVPNVSFWPPANGSQKGLMERLRFSRIEDRAVEREFREQIGIRPLQERGANQTTRPSFMRSHSKEVKVSPNLTLTLDYVTEYLDIYSTEHTERGIPEMPLFQMRNLRCLLS